MHENFMQRCIQLANSGLGNVAPNPLVGAVIVHNNCIIGEGYHTKYGSAHAEVNAINSVANPELLKESTIYVNLEPCSHYGKTPPCADLIISKKIPKVVIGTQDPFAAVSGRGIEKLRNADCNVMVGILAEQCNYLNRRFFTFHNKKRPYIILKWAQTIDGFIDVVPEKKQTIGPTWITDEKIRLLVHKWRSEEQAILTGKNTVVRDNPELTTRTWFGKNPLRIVVANTLPDITKYRIFDNSTPTIVFSKQTAQNLSDTEFYNTSEQSDFLSYFFEILYTKNIQSVIIEGGAKIFEMFVNSGIWDEARILTGHKHFGNGIPAPVIDGKVISEKMYKTDTVKILQNSAF